MTYLRTPKGYTLAILLPIALIAARFEVPTVWIHLAVTVGAAVLSDLVFMLLKYRKLRLPDGALLTGLILALILAPITPLHISALCAAVAIASRHLIRSWRCRSATPTASRPGR